ncbi:MAG: type II secretion system F family protein [Aeromicrobium erythreum]
MGTLIGLGLGLGILLVWRGWTDPRPRAHRQGPDVLTRLLVRAGLGDVSPLGLVGVCAGAAAVGGLVMLVMSGVLVVAAVFAALSGLLPVAVVRGRAARRLREHAELWPDVVDNLASAVRAGLSLPEALIQVGERGPSTLREPFARFARDYQATGRFHDSLDLLKQRLADPVGDRVVESLRVAREVGGGDLGRVLRSLSGFLRDDLRTRSELEARQSWTVNGARLAVAAPWLVLLAMSLQRDVVDRYGTPTGALVLGGGALVSVVAYRLMMAIGRLPTPRRVLA